MRQTSVVMVQTEERSGRVKSKNNTSANVCSILWYNQRHGNKTQKALPPQCSRQRHGQERRRKDTCVAWPGAFLEGQQSEEDVWRWMAEGKAREGEGQEESGRKVKWQFIK